MRQSTRKGGEPHGQPHQPRRPGAAPRARLHARRARAPSRPGRGRAPEPDRRARADGDRAARREPRAASRGSGARAPALPARGRPGGRRNLMNRALLEKPFAPAQIRQRKGRNGVLDYVEGYNVIARLNEALDGAWSFEITHHEVREDEVVVLGKLSAEGITKM